MKIVQSKTLQSKAEISNSTRNPTKIVRPLSLTKDCHLKQQKKNSNPTIPMTSLSFNQRKKGKKTKSQITEAKFLLENF